MRAPVPMSPTRLTNTVNNFFSEEPKINSTIEGLSFDEKDLEFIPLLAAPQFKSINKLASEVLIKENLLSEEDSYSPKAKHSSGMMKWGYEKPVSVSTFEAYTTFTYTSPFEATFTFIHLDDSHESTTYYRNEISKFANQVITSFQK